MDLISTGSKCYYRGRRVPKGEQFSAERQFARALVAMKQAKPAPETAPRVYTPRTYSTRAIPRAATETVVMEADRSVPSDAESPPASVAPVDSSEDLKTLRREYTEALGKRPFPGWSADVLRAKIAAGNEA